MCKNDTLSTSCQYRWICERLIPMCDSNILYRQVVLLINSLSEFLCE